MRIREYDPSDYEQIISLWIECDLMESNSNATSEMLLAFFLRNKGLFLVCEVDSKLMEES